MDQLEWNFSGVARLVLSNFWVGSTPAQSQPGSTWLAKEGSCEKKIVPS